MNYELSSLSSYCYDAAAESIKLAYVYDFLSYIVTMYERNLRMDDGYNYLLSER